MRDNHKGMPEIIDAFEKDGIYGGIVEIEIDNIYKKFEFGVSRRSYLLLKCILQIRPFDMMPGIKYRYFFAGSYHKNTDDFDCGMEIGVEQDKNAKNVDVRVPKDLLANLIWCSQLKNFDEAAHLPEVK
ncbi:hypothetical protein BH10ACI1_BH10ACI1_09050 [soil metagenome]